jgi:hypothetical protein
MLATALAVLDQKAALRQRVLVNLRGAGALEAGESGHYWIIPHKKAGKRRLFRYLSYIKQTPYVSA